ncbi:heterokaryon incompatibility protein-domain-containing protein [Dactylonectria estremocensis]|uniref:Heterokaryon incompatibility protein-domain-containing protein n=1 Tax=Dactylonectria estremocensis TaxID=1079267 RepID=A0A9P9FKG8_9HYPO|nr:heterokaryon incompatibility protein-domain-containing protein [Dactylonectria estremocensis]
MRLLNTQTLAVEFFAGNDVPGYAILSHTWGKDEVTLDDVQKSSHAEMLSRERYSKLRGSCEIATSFGLDYIWIDTCCIDKSSSAELSEAINSMFRWYAESTVCIAYLEDVGGASNSNGTHSEFKESRWFTRGWTLQELIAPSKVIFYGDCWVLLGNRDSLKKDIEEVTRIPEEVLEANPQSKSSRDEKLRQLSIAEKMNWAARRETTRSEDAAYCLLGLFDIHMPLLYGEGQKNAFKRLQEEIIKSTDDESIYAWCTPRHLSEGQDFWGLLAESPAAFDIDHGLDDINGLVPKRSKYISLRSGFSAAMTNRGLHLELPLTPLPTDRSGTIFLAFLNCELRRGQASINPAILLQRTSWDNDAYFVRIRPDMLVLSMMNNIILPDELLSILAKDTIEPLTEAVSRQIFVPHNAPEIRYLKGMIFHPEMKDPDEQSPYALQVRSRSPTWQYFYDMSKEFSGSPESYEINFDTAPGPSVEDLTSPKVLGVLELSLTGVHGSQSERTCLVAGVEPLPSNPFGTAALYYLPWYAFENESRIAKNNFEGVLDKSQRRDSLKMLHTVKVSIEMESKYSSLFYSISLKIEKKTSQDGGILWF